MSRETVARSRCHACSGDVAIKTNVSGRAYYTCDHCGFKGQHTWQRSSDSFLAKVAPKPAPKADPAPAGAAIVPPRAPAPRNFGTALG